jgi:hypothetical protein
LSVSDPNAAIAAELRAVVPEPADDLLLWEATNVLSSIREIQAAGVPRHTRAYYRSLRLLFRATARALAITRPDMERLLRGVTGFLAGTLAALEAAQTDLGLVSAAIS